MPVAMSEKEKKELDEALEEKKRRSAAARYTDEYEKAVEETFRYASMNSQNLQEVVKTLTTGMTKRKQGDLGTWDWDVMKQTVKDQASATKTARKYGLFDRGQYAVNPGTVAMVSDDYLKALAENLPGRITQAQEADEKQEEKIDLMRRQYDEWGKLYNEVVSGKLPQEELWTRADWLLKGNPYEAYNSETYENAWDQMDDETFFADQKRLEKQYNAIDWEKRTKQPEIGREQDLYTSMVSTYQEWQDFVTKTIKNRERLNELQSSIRGNADYESMSQYTGQSLREGAFSNVHKFNRDDAAFVNDLYSFINSNMTHEQKQIAWEQETDIDIYLAEGYDMLTQDELSDYNYLYNAGRMDEAAEYLELLRDDLLVRRAKVNQAYIEAYSTADAWHAAAAWTNAIANQAATMFMVPFQMYETAQGRDHPYSSFYDANNTADWTAQAQLGAIDSSNMPGLVKGIASSAYKGATGAANNGVRLLLAGGNPTVALIGAGLSSTSSSLHESSWRDDMSAAAKIVKAIGMGALEVGTEKIGLDALFDMGQANALSYLKSLIAAELGEETINYISEDVLEMAVGFLFDYEPEIKSGAEFWQGLTETWITTAISSGMMGAPGTVSIHGRNSRTGKAISSNGNVEQLLSIAESMGETSKAAETAKEIRKKTAGGKKASIPQLGMLTFQLEQELGAEKSAITNQVMEDAIEERLVELGSDAETAKKNKGAVRKIAFGEELNAIEKARVKWDQNASQVVKELAKPIAKGEEMRTGHSWKVNAYSRARNASLDARGKSLRLRDALTNKSSTASAVGKARERAKALTKGNANAAPKAIAFDDGTEGGNGTGEFKSVVKRGNETFVAIAKDGGETVEVPVEKLTFVGDEGLATIIEYAAYESRHEMSSEEVNILAESYEQQGGDVENFINAFETSYLSGYIGIEAAPSDMAPELQKIAYDSGRKEAIKDEVHRVANAKNARKLENPTFGWIGDVDSDRQITGIGDASALDEAMKGFTDSQRAMVEFGNELGRAAGTNVVYFASKPGANGDITVQNGSYDKKTRTIYLDVNTGANTANERNSLEKSGTLGDAIGRVLGHEVTHVLESSSVVYYAKYKQAVKNALTDKGLDLAKLVREKIDAALAKGEKLTYAEAEAEVIADASEYMLQDSKFVQNLDASLKGKVKAAIRDFIEKVNEAFRRLGLEGHVESRLLRTMTDGVAHYEKLLQDLWGMSFDEMLGAEVGSNTMTEDEEFSDEKKTVDDAIAYPEDDGYTEKPLPAEAEGDLAPVRTEGVATDKVPHPDDSVEQKIQKSTRDDGSTYKSEVMTVADGMQDTDGKRMFSLRSFNEDYDTYRTMLLNHNVSVDDVNDLFDTVDEIMKAIEKNRDILDFGWNVGREERSFNPVKPNSDPLYEVSLDFSTLCRKRLLQQAVQDRLESMYDTVLTKAERVAIRNELMKLREEGKQIEVACALCYVESTRLKSPAQIQRFFDDRRAVMVDYFSKKNKAYMKEVNARADELIVKFGHEPGTKKNKLNRFQKKAVENLKQSMYKKYTPSAEEEAIITTALELPGESFKTEKGLWNLKKEHEEIFDAYTSFVRNATKSKGIEGDEAWWAGDSKSISDKLIEKMNKENGLRTQSWSDFQVIHLLDYIAAIIELSTRGAKMQSYTKVPDFVKLMGDTGVMINLSLIPKGFDGTLNYDPIEGMPIEEALALREMFPNTVGTICIGITDKHIRMLLADPNTDYVIPYHSSSLDKKTRQQMGMKVWEDFQSYQNEKNKDYPNTVDGNKTYRKSPLFSEWFDYSTVSERAKVVGAERAMQEAADRYIGLCHRRGLQEKFAQFASEPNYWKLLIDRKMINQQTGEIIKQEAVQPRFNKDRILDILSAEVNRFKAQNADKDAAVEHIVKAWENGEIRRASKSKKVIDQVSAFNETVTVANIVASAAELDAQEHTQKSIRDMPEDTVTYRDYLTEADSSIAATIEERNALSIYQKLLKNHAEASEKVIEAEAALAAADEAHKPEARKALAAARVKQKDLYNRLLNVERQAHVQTLVNRSNQIIGDLYGKDQAELDKMLADKERRIASLKADLTGLKGAARTQREADIREQEREMAALKSKATKALLANSERYQQKMQEIRDRRDINIEIGKRQRHIKRVVKRLNDRIVHEEDYRNIKEQMKPAVHELVRTFIDGFGNLVFDSKSADRLRRVYDAIANEDAAPEFYSNDVSDMLTELAELAEKDANRRAEGSSAMSALQEKLDTYAKVAEIADHINKMVTAADEVFVNGKRENFSTISAEVGNGLTAIEDKTLWVGKVRDAIRIVDDLLRTGNMTPPYFFKHLKNSGLSKLFEGLTTGRTKYAQALRQGQDAILDAKRRYNFHSWHHMKKGVEFRTDQGHTILLTTPQMMWVYATAKREATNSLMDTHHLDQGGFRYEAKDLPRQKGKIAAIPGIDRLHKLSAADVKKITDTLTAEQKACADELVGYLSNECAEQGNRASMELFGIRKYKESYYFPFKTASDQRYQHSAAGSTSTTNDARVKHTSFTHSLRKGANTPLVMGDFFQVISDHINEMATYASFVVPIESMNRVLNAKVNEEADGSGNDVTIRSLLGRKHGESAQKYIADLMKDLNGGPQTDNRGTVSALFRAFKRGAVMGSLSVSLQQITAIARAFAYVNPKYFAHITMEGNKKTWERMMKHSGTAVIKDMGKFDVGTGKMASDWIANADLQDFNVWKRGKFLLDTQGFNAFKNNWVEWATQLPGVMDRIAWTHIWKAIEAEQADAHPGMDRNSDEFQNLVGKRFDYVIDQTQVYDSILSKSQNMRSKNPFAQMSTAFMAESTLNFNMLYDALTGKHTPGERAGIVASVAASSIFAAAMAPLITAWNKDDDDRKWQEKYLSEFASRAVDGVNPLTMIPYVADVWSMMNGYDIERTDLSVLKDLIDYADTFISKAKDPDKANTWRDYENLFGSIANLTGIPAKNVSRDIRRVRNFLATDKSASSKATLKYTLLENIWPLGLYDDSNKAYYQRLVSALMDGDTQESYDLREYLTQSKGVEENTVNEGVRNAYRDEYKRGGIDKQTAINFLLDHNLVSGDNADKKKQKAFQYVDKWDEGNDGYSAYNTLKDAFAGGDSSNIQTAWRELTSNGYTDDQIKSQAKTLLKELVQNGAISPTQATKLLRKYAPYVNDKDNLNKPNEWLGK